MSELENQYHRETMFLIVSDFKKIPVSSTSNAGPLQMRYSLCSCTSSLLIVLTRSLLLFLHMNNPTFKTKGTKRETYVSILARASGCSRYHFPNQLLPTPAFDSSLKKTLKSFTHFLHTLGVHLHYNCYS